MTAESKIKRRSKKDNLDRDFLCGCGKQYLSYPALYTHIKTKHNGVEPSGTIKPNLVKSKARPSISEVSKPTSKLRTGKQKSDREIETTTPQSSNCEEILPEPKEEAKAEERLEKNSDSQFPVVANSREQVELQTTILEEKQLISPLGNYEAQELIQELLEEDAMIQKYGASGVCNPLQNFPFLYSNVPHPVACRINEFQSKGLGFNPEASVDHAFAFFLSELSKKANPSFYNAALEIVLSFRDCINAHGAQSLSAFFKDECFRYFDRSFLSFSVSQPQMKLSAFVSPQFIFICAGCFLREFKPQYSSINSEFAKEFIVMMNKWMVRKSLSTVVLNSS